MTAVIILAANTRNLANTLRTARCVAFEKAHNATDRFQAAAATEIANKIDALHDVVAHAAAYETNAEISISEYKNAILATVAIAIELSWGPDENGDIINIARCAGLI